MQEWQKDDFLISTDPSRLDVKAIHAFLSNTYWSKNVPLEIVERSLKNSICFGLYLQNRQIGLSRVVTDRATFAWVADVYVIDEFRGRGLAQWMMKCVLAHPDLQGLRAWLLGTRDMHRLYEKCGFVLHPNPERMMKLSPPISYGEWPTS